MISLLKRSFLTLAGRMWVALENAGMNHKYSGYRERYSIDPLFRFNGNGILLYGEGEIIFGPESYIGRGSSVQAAKGQEVNIGRSCAISHYVAIYTSTWQSDQKFDSNRDRAFSAGNVVIADHAWVGYGVFVCPNIRIGKNSIIGANSVVTRDVPDGAIVAGTPAEIIRYKGSHRS